MKSSKLLGVGLTVLALALAGGCDKKGSPANGGGGGGGKGAPAEKEAHGAHGAGPHGGAVGDWGGGKYHVEFTVDHDKKEATVYILGSDEKTAAPVAAKDGEIKANVKGVKTKDSFDLVLKASPQQGESGGKSSRYVGKHEKIGVVQEFEGTISGEVDGKPYTGNFKEEPAGDEKK